MTHAVTGTVDDDLRALCLTPQDPWQPPAAKVVLLRTFGRTRFQSLVDFNTEAREFLKTLTWAERQDFIDECLAYLEEG